MLVILTVSGARSWYLFPKLMLLAKHRGITRKIILSIDDLHVWFELKRFGFGHAGYVKAVDGVTFDIHEK